MAKVKIPKRVGGVKIPKKVRKQAKKAIKVAESPVVRQFAAAALGAVAQKKVDDAEAGPGPRHGRHRARGVSVTVDGDRLAQTIRTAAIDGLRRFLEGFEEGLRNAAEAEEDDRPKGGPRPANDPPAAAAAE